MFLFGSPKKYDFHWCCPMHQASGFIERNDRLWQVGNLIRIGNEVYSVDGVSEYQGLPLFTLTLVGPLADHFEQL